MSNDDQLEFKIGEDEQAADVELNDETGEATLQSKEEAPVVEQEEAPGQKQEEELEQYSLDSLKFVGNIEKDGKTWALITAPDKAVYRVLPGNHIGTNYGEILKITEDSILLKEIIPNGVGGWTEREASLDLSE